MLIWAMTGAFYPAIDLVAGEKERGTLETLLCSPALRSEIVWGKLATVTTFSMLTAILNAGSMLVTSSFVFKQIGVAGGTIGSPPLAPMLWLLVALVPLSALFSALALAVAALARSSKEGQYYLMPLMMVTLPLVLLPMLPGTTLSLGVNFIFGGQENSDADISVRIVTEYVEFMDDSLRAVILSKDSLFAGVVLLESNPRGLIKPPIELALNSNRGIVFF